MSHQSPFNGFTILRAVKHMPRNGYVQGEVFGIKDADFAQRLVSAGFCEFYVPTEEEKATQATGYKEYCEIKAAEDELARRARYIPRVSAKAIAALHGEDAAQDAGKLAEPVAQAQESGRRR